MQTEKKLIYPEAYPISSQDQESLEVWGFSDSGFTINPAGNVVMKGSRYPLCGQELPTLLPWIQRVMEIELDVKQTHPSAYPPLTFKPFLNSSFINEIKKFLNESHLSDDPQIRLRHGHGHTQYEMYAIKYGKLKRIPDWVVYPSSEEDVVRLVEAASRHNVCLIPYGGGTSVTQALLCPENEERMIVSVDMQRMNRIVWIDPVNRMACIEAGALGRHIAEGLGRHGFTMGHEPDSVEFSTLGGWIATHASGMKKNRYGNIEDLVLDMRVVTPLGLMSRTGISPRESIGIDPRLEMFGSEGNFGIITSAIVKIFPLPEVQKYDSLIFPSFESGVSFMYELTQKGLAPASIRLVDNVQFQFSLALKPKATGLKAWKSHLEKFYVTRLRGFDPQQMVAATLVFEGAHEEVARQEKGIKKLSKKFGGLSAGPENGKRGYQLTFSIAYIRDFVMNFFIVAESFETAVPWSQTVALCDNVKNKIREECIKNKIPGKPFVTCRVTQVYETGVCVYFYFGFYHKGIENPDQLYSEIEEMAREEVLRQGGSLSHHHGVGKLRKHFLKAIASEAILKWNQKIKEAVDPQNIFGCGNQLVGARFIAPDKMNVMPDGTGAINGAPTGSIKLVKAL